MQLVAAKTNTVGESFTTVVEKKAQETEYQGSPVYMFRSMFTEISQLGSDLTVEPFDDVDF